MPIQFDPVWLTGPVAGIFIIIGIFIILRKDVLKTFDENRLERKEMQESHRQTIKDLADNFQLSIQHVSKMAAESERLSEARFTIVLKEVLNDKKSRG